MDVNTKNNIAIAGEFIGEALMGIAAGTIMKKVIGPKCSKGNYALVLVGSVPVLWLFGRKFGKEYYKYTDEFFGTELSWD